MARKPRLTPALQQAIVTAVTGGVPYYQACLLSDIPPTTASEWLERGEGRHPERPCTPFYASFAAAIARAKSQDEARRILRLNQAAQGGAITYEKTTTYPDGRVQREVRHAEPNVQADMFHLERCYWERWGRSLQAEVKLDIRAIAATVAQETGLDPAMILLEAQALLEEADHGRKPEAG